MDRVVQMPLNFYRNLKRKLGYETAPNWSNLPQELLVRFAEHLDFRDQVRFCVVCKNWRQIRDAIDKPASARMPWLLTKASGNKFCIDEYSLYDPDADSPDGYLIKNKNKNKKKLDYYQFVRAGPRWLLLQQVNKPKRSINYTLFNPFSKEIIKMVPEFRPLEPNLYMVTFSYIEESKSCILFFVDGISNPYIDEKIRIRTWNSRTGRPLRRDFWYPFCNFKKIFHVLSIKKTLYLIFRDGQVGAFNGVKGDWSLIVYKSVDIEKFSRFLQRWNGGDVKYYVVECEGEIFFVRDTQIQSWDFCRLDLEAKTWVDEGEEFGKRMLFVSHDENIITGSVLLVSTDDEEDLYASGVYYRSYTNHHCCYYHYKNGYFSRWKFSWPEPELESKNSSYLIWMKPPPL